MLLMPFATDCLRNLSESVATLLARADQPTPAGRGPGPLRIGFTA